MKVIERSLEVLPQSAARIASSMEAAATTVTEQGKAFADDVVSCANSLKADVKAIAEQMEAIPALIDPAPILECCTEALNTAAGDLRKLGTDAAAIPQRLLEQVATVQQVVDEAARTAKSLPGLIPALSKLVPDFDSQLTFFYGLPARGGALASQARRAAEMFEHYGGQLIPLSEQLAQLGAQDVTGRTMAQAVVAQAKALQSDSLAQVQALRGTLQTNVADLTSGVDDATSKALLMIGGASDLVRKTGSDLMAPLQAQINYVERMQGALRDEAAACDALFDDGAAQLGRVGDIVLKPMAEARARVDAVIEQLKAAAANVDSMLKKTLQPIDALEARAGTIKQALDDLVSVIGEEVIQIQGLLADLDADAEKAKTALTALPENFAPVRAKIAEAVALLEEIKGRIPVFVATANRALDGAASELDQAEGRCNEAIEICTRYMMKAPPLMAARTLFMGVKSMIPGVKTSIVTARKSVEAAGTTASGLMDQGISAVEALYPLLDQAIAKLQIAVDALVALLVKLQAALQQVSELAGAIPPELSKQLEVAATAMHDVLNKVRATVQECLAKLECETLVQRLQQELSALLDRTMTTVDQKITEASAPLQKALQQGREAVGQAAELAQESLRTLHSALINAQMQAQTPIHQLAETMASWQSRITSLSSTAKLQISQAEAKVLTMADQITQKIAALTIEVPNLPIEVQSVVSSFSTFTTQISTDARTVASQAGSLNDWQKIAQQSNDLIAVSIDQASAEVAQGLAEVRTASDNLRAEAQSACEAAVNIEATVTEIEVSMTRMKSEAQSVADSADAALVDMDDSLQEASAEAEVMVDHYAPASEQLLEEAQAQFDSATAIAEEAKQAEQGLAAEIAAAETSVGQASQQAAAQTEALKDEAQAGLDATLVEVQAVQTQVEAARTDVIAAEAIVDAEVVKHGGESALVKPAETATSTVEDNAAQKDDKQSAASGGDNVQPDTATASVGSDATGTSTAGSASGNSGDGPEGTASDSSSAEAGSPADQSTQEAVASNEALAGATPDKLAASGDVAGGPAVADRTAPETPEAGSAESAASLQPADGMNNEASGIAAKDATPVESPDKPPLPDRKDIPTDPQADKPLKKAGIDLPSGAAFDGVPEQGVALDLSATTGGKVLAAREGDNAIDVKNQASGQGLQKSGAVEKGSTAFTEKPLPTIADSIPVDGKNPANFKGDAAAATGAGDASRNASATNAAPPAQKAAIEPFAASAKSPSDIVKPVGDGQAGSTNDVIKAQVQGLPLQEIAPGTVGTEGAAPMMRQNAVEQVAPAAVADADVTKAPVNPAPANAKDAESVVKEALRARLTDAASKELI